MNDLTWIDSPELAAAFKAKWPIKIDRVAPINVAWDDIHTCINDDTIFLHPGAYIIESINYQIFPWVKEVEDKLLKTFPPRTGDVSTHLYASLYSGAKTLGKHMDTADVFYIGGIGTTSFVINESVYEIKSGDVLYIPRSVDHTPTPTLARAGFSIGLEHGRHDT
jgi:mannose-6-phosphate isomerase-like protein (cupin superfamily)